MRFNAGAAQCAARGICMQTVTIRDAFIKLGQAMKLAGLVETGAEAKAQIEDGRVLVNGETELRRGRKLYDGDRVSFDGKEFTVASPVKRPAE